MARRQLRIAVEGCAHGDLERIYASLAEAEARAGAKVDLLICCGDFQAVRNRSDLHCMAVPEKYKAMQTFHRYYSGELVAPVLTIFIGGNHEAANHLQELYYGGWAAPNIYFMGFSGVVRFGGLRIAGLSGIFKSGDYNRGYYEAPPYDRSSVRSIYHVRKFEEMKLAMLTRRRTGREQLPRDPGAVCDIFVSHDWPRGIARHGDTAALLRKKKFFRQEVQENTLGSPPGERLMMQLRPSFWFAAHLHVKFAALVRHAPVMSDTWAGEGAASEVGAGAAGATADAEAHAPISAFPRLPPVPNATQFLSLDKCMPRKHFLQLFEVPVPAGAPLEERSAPLRLYYDKEWLSVLQETQHGMPVQQRRRGAAPPATPRPARAPPTCTPSGGNFPVPLNFMRTAPIFDGAARGRAPVPQQIGSPQTDELVAMLGLAHTMTVPWGASGGAMGDGPIGSDVAATPSAPTAPTAATSDPNAIALSDSDEDPATAGSMPSAPTAPTAATSDPNAIALSDSDEDPATAGSMAPLAHGGASDPAPLRLPVAAIPPIGRAPPRGTMLPPLGFGPSPQPAQQRAPPPPGRVVDNRPAWQTQAESAAAAADPNEIVLE